jgi:hypothetical protein
MLYIVYTIRASSKNVLIVSSAVKKGRKHVVSFDGRVDLAKEKNAGYTHRRVAGVAKAE